MDLYDHPRKQEAPSHWPPVISREKVVAGHQLHSGGGKTVVLPHSRVQGTGALGAWCAGQQDPGVPRGRGRVWDISFVATQPEFTAPDREGCVPAEIFLAWDSEWHSDSAEALCPRVRLSSMETRVRLWLSRTLLFVPEWAHRGIEPTELQTCLVNKEAALYM